MFENMNPLEKLRLLAGWPFAKAVEFVRRGDDSLDVDWDTLEAEDNAYLDDYFSQYDEAADSNAYWVDEHLAKLDREDVRRERHAEWWGDAA